MIIIVKRVGYSYALPTDHELINYVIVMCVVSCYPHKQHGQGTGRAHMAGTIKWHWASDIQVLVTAVKILAIATGAVCMIWKLLYS